MMKSTKSTLLAASALALMLTTANAQEYGPGSYDDGYNAPPPPSDYGPGPYGNDDYGPPPADYGPPPEYGDGYGAPANVTENVIVIAPRYRTDHSSLAPTEITKLSMNVAYDDLDLRSAAGAHELRDRVRDTAHDVCDRLVARFPHALYDTTSCYKQALYGGMNRADTAIHEARNYAYYDYRK